MQWIVIQPLYRCLCVAEKISKGDFSEQLHFRRRDEIGLLADAFNGISTKLADLFGQMTHGIEKLHTASGELSDASTRMARNAGQSHSKHFPAFFAS